MFVATYNQTIKMFKKNTMQIKLIFISGTSSTGKSTASRILHNQLQQSNAKWLNFKVDDFLRMIGSRYLDLFHNQEIYKNGVPEYLTKQNDYYFVENDELKYGELSSKLFYLIPDFLEQLLQQDFYIIADAFFETDEDIKNLKERFKQYNPQFIYFQASKETRDKREAERMDRIKGMSDRWLKSFKCEYLSDIMIDTDNLTPEEVAAKILNYLGNC